MSGFDYSVLLVTLLGIAAYGTWRTRGRRDLDGYLKGKPDTSWIVIGLSVMATQASAITFLSAPGQAYQDGLGFLQKYLGAPFALIIICAVFLPLYRRLNVYTAYEYLGKRFDARTRLLGAGLFLLQRGLAAGITIYAPAIVLTTVMGWRLDLTIVGCGLVVIVYTVTGGSDAVNTTQKYQVAVMFAGMAAAFFVVLSRLPAGLSLPDALTLAGGYGKLRPVDFSLDVTQRYTFWSGLLGGLFLDLSYFGTDQSQVQRYLSGSSLRASRLGLMFNAVFKIPMQFFILLLGALVFVFYQFEPAPVVFNRTAWETAVRTDPGGRLQAFERTFAAARAEEQRQVRAWIEARHGGDLRISASARALAVAAHDRSENVRAEARALLEQADPGAQSNDADYVFIRFVLDQMPHGLIGLLMAVFFAATLSSLSAELSALGATAAVDVYRHVVRSDASDAHYVAVSKGFTIFWGLVAIGFALFAGLVENLIQAVNIVGSIFYGVVLALFLAAFFLKWVGGRAVFWAALASQALIFVLYATLDISYLWYNVIGCAACLGLSVLLEAALSPKAQTV